MKARATATSRQQARPQPEPYTGKGDEGRDYTQDILAFLHENHGRVRQDAQGDHYYQGVSTISLHLLLRSALPPKELLWQWYRYFEEERGESVYISLPPHRDEDFLQVLRACGFLWNPQAVQDSGLVFLQRHRDEVFIAVEDFLGMRIDAFHTMHDEDLRRLLSPINTWSEQHVQKLVKSYQLSGLTLEQRQSVYSLFSSDYLRATARNLMDQTKREHFWKAPPPELEELKSRFNAMARMLMQDAQRLGVYVGRQEWVRRQQRGRRGDETPRGAGARSSTGGRTVSVVEAAHFATLGLSPAATLPQVKSAYREQVKQHHPDFGGTVQQFLRLQEAYEYLISHVL